MTWLALPFWGVWMWWVTFWLQGRDRCPARTSGGPLGMPRGQRCDLDYWHLGRHRAYRRTDFGSITEIWR